VIASWTRKQRFDRQEKNVYTMGLMERIKEIEGTNKQVVVVG
jgi:hypothetical protein